MTSSNWLTRAEIDRAHGCIRVLARFIADAAPPADASLYRGDVGLALAFAYADRLLPNEGFADATASYCERAVTAIGTLRSPTLHGGLAGVGWLLAHLESELDCAVEETATLRDAVMLLLERAGRETGFDLSVGVAGIGVYAAEIEDAALLSLVVRKLGERAERTDGIRWKSDAAALAPADRARLPNGVYDLGVAHGIAGTLATLGAATAASIAGSRELLEGAIAWLLTQPRPAGGVSRFATWTTGNGADPSARAAWCYGDPGIACALAAASARAGVAAGMAAAVETAHGAALRTPENGRVTDAGLCHGSAGLAVIFARLCETIGGPELHDATRTWLLRTIDYLERDGFAGTSTPQRATCFRGLGLLTGAAGILLALSSLTTSSAAAWDRALGLSIR